MQYESGPAKWISKWRGHRRTLESIATTMVGIQEKKWGAESPLPPLPPVSTVLYFVFTVLLCVSSDQQSSKDLTMYLSDTLV